MPTSTRSGPDPKPNNKTKSEVGIAPSAILVQQLMPAIESQMASAIWRTWQWPQRVNQSVSAVNVR